MFFVSGAEEVMQKAIPARFHEKLLDVDGVGQFCPFVDKKKIQVETEERAAG